MTHSPKNVAPADGKLGVLCVGLGAVTSTLIAGVELAKKGMAQPIGSLTEMGTIRLGKRTDDNVPAIRDFVPLASLDDIVFGAWDPFPDDAFVAAQRAGVLESGRHVEPIADELRSVVPMPAAFDAQYVKRLDGPNVKDRTSKRAMLEGIRADIEAFKEKHLLERVVMIWCGSTEIFIEPGRVHADLEAFETAIDENHPDIAPSMLYAYAALLEGVPFANGAPNLTVDVPALREYATEHNVPICGKDFKTGQTLIKTVLAPMLKARMLGLDGWYSTNILGNRDGEVLDDPESFKTKEESKLGVLEHVLEPDRYPELYGNVYHKVRINYYPPRRRQQGGLGQHRSVRVDGLSHAAEGRLPLPRLHPGRPAGAGPVPVHGPGPAGRHGRHPGVAELLLQVAPGRPRPLSRARPVHPAHQAEEHAALDHGRGADHPPGHRLLPGQRRLIS